MTGQCAPLDDGTMRRPWMTGGHGSLGALGLNAKDPFAEASGQP